MSQTEDQNYEQTLQANFEFVESEPIVATFSISPNIQDLNYTYFQDVPSETWVIKHNLNKYPSVTTISSAGDVVYGNVKYIDSNNVEVEFTSAFAGRALIN